MSKKAGVKRENPNALKQIVIALEAADGLETKVGWFPGAVYEDGTTVASVAAENEYGNPAKRVPPRSFMRTTIAARQQYWKKITSFGARAIIAGKKKPVQIMRQLGLAAAGDIKKKITEIVSPPLAQSTIQARKAKMAAGKRIGNLTKPLVESSLMLSSLTHTVEKK
jgi:hypothetical protein